MDPTSYVVGAYASLPSGRDDQERYYALLGSDASIDGSELPFPGDLADPDSRAWLARALPGHWHRNTVTMIPGTMQRIGRDPRFGLACGDETGRLAAVAQLIAAREAIADMADIRGANDVAFIEIHTGPTGRADASAMRRTLDEITAWDWLGTGIVIEHCDRFIAGRKPEKGFLPIDDEIALCRDAGIGLTVNWGRSCVEGRDAWLPAEHIRRAADAGVLVGLMFSGAGPEATRYGYEWIDGHLPMAPDEPTSWMDAAAVGECARLAAASPALAYVGAKVCVPAEADLDERAAFLSHIRDAAGFGGRV
ncbi:DUF4862 family protein [Bifidobacterium sp. MA2]|uniref:DUF4862 family protein n=1 Tax=Bifidobacterium santillanense TaxID=2809028 RepID=A0ABS5UQY0_9BIFI|nr:DUF4862 family protein [Bifidobacterium santillanense]MBT1173228.1 DUF4862 family protein [Bifidobacterium santillanense]